MSKGIPRIRKNQTTSFPKQDTGVVSIPFSNVLVTITDPGAASGFGSAVISGLPAGDWVLAGVSYVQFSSPAAGIIATYSGTYTIGTTATADATLLGTSDADIVGQAAAVAFGPAVAGVSAVARGQLNAGTAYTPTLIDNRAGTKNINLNVTIVDASLTSNSSIRASGILYLHATHLGDD